MRQIVLLVFILIPCGILSVAAQIPPPPVPTVESDVRQNSIRMRSNELERIKREAERPAAGESTIEREIKFSEIKKDFEGIQKLQDSIVKVYTTGKKINYSKIGDLSTDLRKNAVRLGINLFNLNSDGIEKEIESESLGNADVRQLIIDLDNSIGSFVGSPIFQNTKVVDRNESENARIALEKILKISSVLAKESKKID